MGLIEGIKKMWNATVFPEMIAEKKRKKAEMKVIYDEAEREAMQELKPQLKEQIKQQHLDKMTGKGKTDKWKKFADNMKLPDSIGSTDKINQLLGKGRQTGYQQPQQQQYYEPQEVSQRLPPRERRKRKRSAPQYRRPSPPPLTDKQKYENKVREMLK